jgi:hypothetical protein
MTNSFDDIVARMSGEGRRLYARWDSARFAQLCQQYARSLAERLAQHPDPTDEATLTGYLTLVREAVGAGYLGRALDKPRDGSARASGFLEYAFLCLIPESLPDEPPETRTGWLAKVWNLAEGVRNGPPWIDGYVSAFASELKSVREIESFLSKALEPALEPAQPCAWKGPFTTAILDTRAVHDPFLPGRMQLAAPTVLCVQDRRAPAVHLGILLRRGGGSRILGLFPALGAYTDAAPFPEILTESNRLRIGRQTVDLPLLGDPYQVARASAGFIAASALDSQRLWIVESA